MRPRAPRLSFDLVSRPATAPAAGRKATPAVAVPRSLRPRSPALLVGLALASAAVEALIFALPYPLVPHYATPLLDLGKLARYEPSAAVAFSLGFGALFLLYGLGLAVARGLRGPAGLWLPIGGAALQFLTLVPVYPVGAADVFDYLLHARVWVLHGANPLLTAPARFPGDPLLPYIAWPDAPSAYGPLWMALSAPATLAGDDLLVALLLLKLLIGLAFVGTLAIMAATVGPERRALALVLFGWNPLVLYEFAVNAHNDAWMVFFLLLAVLLYRRRSPVGPASALAAGGLVKFLTYPLVPVFLAAEVRRRGLVAALVAGAVAVALVLLGYLPFLAPGDLLGLERRRHMLTASLPALAYLRLAPVLGDEPALRLVNGGATLLFGLAVLAATIWVWRRSADPVRTSFEVLFSYLLLACLWFQPWYLTWLVALAAVLPLGSATVRAVFYSWTGTLNYLVFVFLWVWNWDRIDVPTIQTWAVLAIHGPVALLTLAIGLASVWRRWLRFALGASSSRSRPWRSGAHR